MRTFEQVIKALVNDSLSHYCDIIRHNVKDQDKKYHKDFVTFAHEVEHYLSLGVKGIGGTPFKFEYTGYRFILVFIYQNKYYAISLARWRYHGEIYAIPEEDAKKEINYLYSYKYTNFGMRGMSDSNTNPEDMFKDIKLPNHARYEVGYVVHVNKKGWSYLYNKLFKILAVEYQRKRIQYTIADIKKPDDIKNHYYVPETHLVKLIEGI